MASPVAGSDCSYSRKIAEVSNRRTTTEPAQVTSSEGRNDLLLNCTRSPPPTPVKTEPFLTCCWAAEEVASPNACFPGWVSRAPATLCTSLGMSFRRFPVDDDSVLDELNSVHNDVPVRSVVRDHDFRRIRIEIKGPERRKQTIDGRFLTLIKTDRRWV